jgi:hypothetical protein
MDLSKKQGGNIMLLIWDAVNGAVSYRVRWRTATNYVDVDFSDIANTQFNPKTITTLPSGQIVFFKVCALVPNNVGTGNVEGQYTAEISYIPAPANLRWE